MSNTTTYLNKDEKQKLERISIKCGVSVSRVLQLVVKNMQEQYFTDLVNTYKDEEK